MLKLLPVAEKLTLGFLGLFWPILGFSLLYSGNIGNTQRLTGEGVNSYRNINMQARLNL